MERPGLILTGRNLAKGAEARCVSRYPPNPTFPCIPPEEGVKSPSGVRWFNQGPKGRNKSASWREKKALRRSLRSRPDPPNRPTPRVGLSLMSKTQCGVLGTGKKLLRPSNGLFYPKTGKEGE